MQWHATCVRVSEEEDAVGTKERKREAHKGRKNPHTHTHTNTHTHTHAHAHAHTCTHAYAHMRHTQDAAKRREGGWQTETATQRHEQGQRYRVRETHRKRWRVRQTGRTEIETGSD
jgi:hypothetical protein